MSRFGHADSSAPSARATDTTATATEVKCGARAQRARLVFVRGAHAARACWHGVPARHSLASFVAGDRYDSDTLSLREKAGERTLSPSPACGRGRGEGSSYDLPEFSWRPATSTRLEPLEHLGCVGVHWVQLERLRVVGDRELALPGRRVSVAHSVVGAGLVPARSGLSTMLSTREASSKQPVACGDRRDSRRSEPQAQDQVQGPARLAFERQGVGLGVRGALGRVAVRGSGEA